tara:strand:+ start:37 stop:813 length:777 start_codon:yes stop_codon:yes gene_type:complete
MDIDKEKLFKERLEEIGNIILSHGWIGDWIDNYSTAPYPEYDGVSEFEVIYEWKREPIDLDSYKEIQSNASNISQRIEYLQDSLRDEDFSTATDLMRLSLEIERFVGFAYSGIAHVGVFDEMTEFMNNPDNKFNTDQFVRIYTCYGFLSDLIIKARMTEKPLSELNFLNNNEYFKKGMKSYEMALEVSKNEGLTNRIPIIELGIKSLNQQLERMMLMPGANSSLIKKSPSNNSTGCLIYTGIPFVVMGILINLITFLI